MCSLRPLAFAGAALFLLAVAPDRARGAFVLTLSETGGNVVVNGAGTLNTTALTPGSTGTGAGDMIPANGVLVSGPAATTPYFNYAGLSGPSAFGSLVSTGANAGSGSLVGIIASTGVLFVPQGYVSGTPLVSSSTYNSSTLSSLGFAPGTYTYTWGTGVTADSLTITSVVPEPSTWAMLGGGAAALVGRRSQRRRILPRLRAVAGAGGGVPIAWLAPA